MIQSFQTDMSGQTVQTQIRLLLEEQSDQGLHCLLFHNCIFLMKNPKFFLFEFSVDYCKIFWCPKILEFYGIHLNKNINCTLWNDAMSQQRAYPKSS